MSRFAPALAVFLLLSCLHASADPDLPLQSAALRAIGREQACVVAVDPRTGMLLAFAGPDNILNAAHPPGSIVKIMTAFAALEAGICDSRTTVECTNSYRAGGKRLICCRPGGHGRVGVEEALAQSCSVFFYSMGERLGPQRLLSAFRDFGLGPPGSLPSRIGGRADLARLAVGESPELRITPIQVALAACAVANGGQGQIRQGGRTMRVRVKGKASSFDVIRRGMRRAVMRGTATRASLPGLNVCGKTGSPGSAENPDHRSAWFVGFTPQEHPGIVVVVFGRYGHGGSTAAPIARSIFKAWATEWGQR